MLATRFLKNKAFIRRFSLLFIAVEGLALVLFGLSTQFTLGFNTTDSLDGHVYLVYKRHKPGKNDIAAFRPPENPYFTKSVFLKIVKGVGGDEVTWKGRDFYVNNDFLGEAKPTTLSGEPLSQSQGGKIGENQFFVWTPHKDSFDSRYAWIGFVDEAQLIGKAVKVL